MTRTDTPPIPPADAEGNQIKWFKVCRDVDLKPGQARSIRLLARLYAVFNVDGKLYGIDGACRHMKASLAAGKLEGRYVHCFMHDWRYDVTTGACLTVESQALRTYPVKIEDGQVKIGIEWPPTPVID